MSSQLEGASQLPGDDSAQHPLTTAKLGRADYLPGFFRQPTRAVRVAYWLVADLRDRGWLMHAVGEPIAGGGFIAETPAGALELHRRLGGGSGSDLADALVHALRHLSFDERDYLRRLIRRHSATDEPPGQGG